jgi:hypothetical protein
VKYEDIGFERVDPFAEAEPAAGNGHASADGITIGRLTARRLSQFRRPSVPKLVHGLIDEAAEVLVYGAWGSGKSLFAVDLACRIAYGEMWRGRTVLQGAVLYVGAEAPHSIENRIRAWCSRHGKLGRVAVEPPIAVIGNAPDLLGGDEDAQAIVEHGRLLARDTGMPLRLVAFDTLHACAPGSKEDAADTGAVLAQVRRIKADLGCGTVLVHHAGKGGSRGARGSSALEAAADMIIEVVEDGAVRTPIVRKLRDGAVPELWPFVIDGVVLAGQGTADEVRVGVHVVTEPVADPGDPRRAKAKAMRAEGQSLAAIARTLGVAKSTVERWVKAP